MGAHDGIAIRNPVSFASCILRMQNAQISVTDLLPPSPSCCIFFWIPSTPVCVSSIGIRVNTSLFRYFLFPWSDVSKLLGWCSDAWDIISKFIEDSCRAGRGIRGEGRHFTVSTWNKISTLWLCLWFQMEAEAVVSNALRYRAGFGLKNSSNRWIWRYDTD